ncbi:enoyl-CoA hydratase/isomerase family protein [Microbacterium sp.]|uniref:enoyl-CoA hydratase/isomerase family protein n=1 Tax=Microbacterium sp. TaxID=51671 RepID=UPI002D777562|nr:enoyl-CoA hydratase/isomerase family protein [Microbacterium sp.]HET6300631.1 enoyl-CoA hydratase/isomerase family protein [Microbacterium sp.]
MTEGAASVDPPVLVRAAGGLGRLTLNRPRAINALDLGMIRELTAALDAWEDDPDVHAVLLDGEGDRGFCAGGDVRTLHQQIVGGDPEATGEFFRSEYALNARIAEYPKPVIALADGITMGGGIGLAGHARVRVVTERSKLAMPETRIGFTPDVGGTWLLGRAPGRLGEYLGLTGATMGAADAVYAGFADAIVPSERLGELREALVLRQAQQPGGAAQQPEDAAQQPGEGDVVERLERFLSLSKDRAATGAPSLEAARSWIDDAFSADTVAEIVERLRALASSRTLSERRRDEARATADTLAELSPTALAVTLAAVRRARELPSLRDALAQEYGLVMWFATTQPDLVEGIRAQLIDKDRDPHWHPATIAELQPDAAASALAYRPTTPLWGAPPV